MPVGFVVVLRVQCESCEMHPSYFVSPTQPETAMQVKAGDDLQTPHTTLLTCPKHGLNECLHAAWQASNNPEHDCADPLPAIV